MSATHTPIRPIRPAGPDGRLGPAIDAIADRDLLIACADRELTLSARSAPRYDSGHVRSARDGVTMQIGIDLGGSNLRAAAFGDGDAATPLEVRKEPVGDDRAPEAIVERVARTIEGLAGGAAGPVAVGIGLAALLRDRRGTVANSPHLRWRDVPFGALLVARQLAK